MPKYSLHNLLRKDMHEFNETLNKIFEMPTLEVLNNMQIWQSEMDVLMGNLGKFYQQYDEFVDKIEE